MVSLLFPSSDLLGLSKHWVGSPFRLSIAARAAKAPGASLLHFVAAPNHLEDCLFGSASGAIFYLGLLILSPTCHSCPDGSVRTVVATLQ